jgi:tape measure domain-containing protein
MATERIDIVITETGSREIVRSFAEIGKNAEKVQEKLNSVRNSAAGLKQVLAQFSGQGLINTLNRINQTAGEAQSKLGATRNSVAGLKQVLAQFSGQAVVETLTKITQRADIAQTKLFSFRNTVGGIKQSLSQFSGQSLVAAFDKINQSSAGIETRLTKLIETLERLNASSNSFSSQTLSTKLSQLEKSSTAANKKISELSGKVDSLSVATAKVSTRELSASLDKVTDSTKKSQSALFSLNTAIKALSIGILTQELIRLADAYTTILNKIRLVTDGTSQLVVVTNELFGIATRTRTPVEALSQLYLKGASAAKELGASQKEILTFTEAVGAAIAIQGGSVQGAQGALLQLGQALGMGTVKSEEFNSMLENAYPLVQAAARGIDAAGGSVAKLTFLVKNGKVSSQEFFRGILSESESLATLLASSAPTVAQAMTVMRNSLVQFIGQLDTSKGITGAFAQTLIALAANLDLVARSILAVSVVLGTYFAGQAVGAAITAIKALTAAMLANPFGLLALAVAAVIGYLVAFGDQIRATGTTFATLADVATAVWEKISAGLSWLWGIFKSVFTSIFGVAAETVYNINTTFADSLRFAAKIADGIAAVFVGAYRAIVTVFSNLPKTLGFFFVEAMNGAVAAVETAINKMTNAINFLSDGEGSSFISLGRIENQYAADLSNTTSKIVDGYKNAFSEIKGTQTLVEDVLKRADVIASERNFKKAQQEQGLSTARTQLAAPVTASPIDTSKQLKGKQAKVPKTPKAKAEKQLKPEETFDDLLKKLQREGELLKLNNRDREVQQGLLELEDRLKRKLSTTEQALATSQLRTNQALAEQAILFNDIKAPLDNYLTSVVALDSLLLKGRITLDEYKKKLEEVRGAYLATQTDLASGLERGLMKVNKDLNDAASQIENIITSTFSKVEDALVDFVKTGKLDFRSLVDSIISDLIRLTVRQGIIAPIFNSLYGGGNGSTSFGSFFNNSNIGSSISSGLSSAGNYMGNLLGFATGGDFTVPGGTGVDSRLVAFRATPGEQVIVNKPSADRQHKNSFGSGTIINMNISTPDVRGFRESESQLSARLSRMVNRGRRNL